MPLGGKIGRKIAGAAGLGPLMLAAQGLEQVISQIKGFVEALSPSSVQVFTQSLKDLNATVGQAFMPAILQMAAIVRSIADQISPLMQALAPVMQELARIVGDALVSGVRNFVTLMNAIGPSLRDMLRITEELRVIFGAASSALAALLSVAIVSLMAVLKTLRPIIDAVIAAFANLVRVAIMVAAFWMRLTGNQAGLDALLKAFDEKKEGGRAVGAGPTSIKGLEQIGKDLALASATAMGAAPEDKQNELLDYVRMIREGIQEIKDGKSFQSFIKEEFDRLIKAIGELAGAGAKAADGMIRAAASGAGVEGAAQDVLVDLVNPVPAVWRLVTGNKR